MFNFLDPPDGTSAVPSEVLDIFPVTPDRWPDLEALFELLTYSAQRPIGWRAVGPRGMLVRPARSRNLAPVDDRPVWSVVCLCVDRAHCGRGVSIALLEAAVRYAGSRGARVVEDYSVERRSQTTRPVFAFTGLASVG